MSHNSFGHIFRFTSWGESHGPALGCVIDGCPAGISLTEADIQYWLDQRKPGSSKFVTQRREPDNVKILSGVFEDDQTDGPHTTGTPISLVIENQDQRSKDYSEIREQFRPGHADYTYLAKYGIRDYRGGGRSSARETAARVAVGAIARKILGKDIKISGAMVQMGAHEIGEEAKDYAYARTNPLWCPDAKMLPRWTSYLDDIRKKGSSIGAVIEVIAEGVPVGWGAPVYGKLDSDLAQAMMSINAVKGVEIGAGFGAASLSGEENADQMHMGKDGQPIFLSNNNGGVLGGISSGQPIIVRMAIKPTSSILNPVQSINKAGEPVELRTKGRHDPCVGIRAVPVAEAMLAIVLADHKLRHRAQMGGI